MCWPWHTSMTTEQKEGLAVQTGRHRRNRRVGMTQGRTQGRTCGGSGWKSKFGSLRDPEPSVAQTPYQSGAAFESISLFSVSLLSHPCVLVTFLLLLQSVTTKATSRREGWFGACGSRGVSVRDGLMEVMATDRRQSSLEMTWNLRAWPPNNHEVWVA